MPDHVVERLFSLFAPLDRAEALAGDLAEERERRGPVWFWLHVAGVTWALWRGAATEAPFRILALAMAGCGLLTAPAFGGVAAVFLFPEMLALPLNWIALAAFWWGGALWTGASLVAISPRRGMAAAASLAVAGGALLAATSGPAVWRDPSNTDFVVFNTIGMLATMPLLAGGALARRRAVRRDADVAVSG